MSLEKEVKGLSTRVYQFAKQAEDLLDEIKQKGPEIVRQARLEGSEEQLLTILNKVPCTGMGACDFEITQLKLELGHRVNSI